MEGWLFQAMYLSPYCKDSVMVQIHFESKYVLVIMQVREFYVSHPNFNMDLNISHLYYVFTTSAEFLWDERWT
jgi:hypothetical protein